MFKQSCVSPCSKKNTNICHNRLLIWRNLSQSFLSSASKLAALLIRHRVSVLLIYFQLPTHMWETAIGPVSTSELSALDYGRFLLGFSGWLGGCTVIKSWMRTLVMSTPCVGRIYWLNLPHHPLRFTEVWKVRMFIQKRRRRVNIVTGESVWTGDLFNEGGTVRWRRSCGTGFGWNTFTASLSFHPPPPVFFQPTSSSLFLSLRFTFPLPLNYGSGGAAAYVRAEAASAKQLSGALGRRSPVAGQPQEKHFFIYRMLDFGIMSMMPRKEGREDRQEEVGNTHQQQDSRAKKHQ